MTQIYADEKLPPRLDDEETKGRPICAELRHLWIVRFLVRFGVLS